MYYRGRDPQIELMQTRKNHTCYGMGLGIIILDDVYPGFPGDVRNASAYPYPIQYDIVRDIDAKKLVFDDDKSQCLQPILDSAKRLEKMGCRAIAAECGYFGYFQREVAEYVDVPVFMSSLLQVPMIQQCIGPKKKVGIFCYTSQQLTDAHLRNVGIDTKSNFVVYGAHENGCEEFDNLWNYEVRSERPFAYYQKSEKEVLAACSKIKAENPDLGAIMLECTGMQPFGRAIQRELDVPVYSWSTTLDYAYSVVNHRDFYGHI